MKFLSTTSLRSAASAERSHIGRWSLTSTEATVDLEKSESVMAAFRDRLPIGRGATPEEVAGVIAFLASEDALFINGVNLPIAGGLHASNGQPKPLLANSIAGSMPAISTKSPTITTTQSQAIPPLQARL
jgi:Enoyl-(Acyl carrier protein) reductase